MLVTWKAGHIRQHAKVFISSQTFVSIARENNRLCFVFSKKRVKMYVCHFSFRHVVFLVVGQFASQQVEIDELGRRSGTSNFSASFVYAF